jgi:hypothetical protein
MIAPSAASIPRDVRRCLELARELDVRFEVFLLGRFIRPPGRQQLSSREELVGAPQDLAMCTSPHQRDVVLELDPSRQVPITIHEGSREQRNRWPQWHSMSVPDPVESRARRRGGNLFDLDQS